MSTLADPQSDPVLPASARPGGTPGGRRPPPLPGALLPLLLIAASAVALAPARAQDAPLPPPVRGIEGLQARLELLPPVSPIDPWRPVALIFRITNTGGVPLPGDREDRVLEGRPGTALGWFPSESGRGGLSVLESRIAISDRPLPPGASVEVRVQTLLRSARKVPFYGFCLWVNGKDERAPIAAGQLGTPVFVPVPVGGGPPPREVRAVVWAYYAFLTCVAFLAGALLVHGRRSPWDLALWLLVALLSLAYEGMMRVAGAFLAALG